MLSTGKSSSGQNQPGMTNLCQLITCSFLMHKRGCSGAASAGTSCVVPSLASLLLQGQTAIAQLGREFRNGMCGAQQAQHQVMSSCLLGHHVGGQASHRLDWAPVPAYGCKCVRCSLGSCCHLGQTFPEKKGGYCCCRCLRKVEKKPDESASRSPLSLESRWAMPCKEKFLISDHLERLCPVWCV